MKSTTLSSEHTFIYLKEKVSISVALNIYKKALINFSSLICQEKEKRKKEGGE